MDWKLVWKHCVPVNSGLRLKLSSLVSAKDWSKKWNDPFQYFVETKRRNFGLSTEFILANHTRRTSLLTVITDVIADISLFLCLFMKKRKSKVIFVHQNLICYRLTYVIMHAKSTGELISFVFSDRSRSVRRLVSDKRSANSWVQTKIDFIFWLIFGLSPNFGLSERLIQKLKWPNVWNDNFTTYFGQILSLQLISMRKFIKPYWLQT